MTIQFNTDRNLTMHDEFKNKLSDLLQKALSRFADRITRLEIHLSDENGGKPGVNDKRCLLEARVAGMQPVAVTADSNNYELAVEDAAEKLKSSLDKTFGRLASH